MEQWCLKLTVSNSLYDILRDDFLAEYIMVLLAFQVYGLMLKLLHTIRK